MAGAHRAVYPVVLDVPRYVFSVQLCGENPVVDSLMNQVTRVRAWSWHNNITTVEPRLDEWTVGFNSEILKLCNKKQETGNVAAHRGRK